MYLGYSYTGKCKISVEFSYEYDVVKMMISIRTSYRYV